MSKKLYRLIVGISGGAAAIAVAVVTYLDPAYAGAVNSSIAVAEAAVAEICSLFVKDE